MTIGYLAIEQVLAVHRMQIEAYGGSAGLRDRGGLEAAVARPAATFGGEDLYPDVAAKAAALMHSLVLNHPCVDGNKRVALHAAMLFAALNLHELLASPDDVTALTLKAAEGQLNIESLTIWFRQRLKPVAD